MIEHIPDVKEKMQVASIVPSLLFYGNPEICMGILVCEEGAKLRGLNLEVAAADAKHWWETGKIPFRATPKV